MEKKHIHYFQHVPYEDPGCIKNWALENNYLISSTNFYEGEPLPDPEDIDWLVIMGGPMSVYEEEKYPWLVDEKNYIKKIIDKKRVALGICLGAQLIAEVLGANVYPNKEKEIGFFPVSFSPDAERNTLFKLLPKTMDVFHWHADTFDLPKDTILIASSEACKNQCFVYDDRVVGIQFHLEADKNIIEGIVDNNRTDITEGRYIQSEVKIKTSSFLTIELNVYMKCILERLQKVNN